MTLNHTFARALIATIALAPTLAAAGGMKTREVLTHPSQGDERTVGGASARMATVKDGVFVSIETGDLKPGHVHTLWFVAIANPAACATTPCTGKDVLKNTDAVMADAGYAGGVIADDDGAARFAHFQPYGDLVNGWFDRGLGDAETTEIHLVVKDHGPALDGRVDDMLSTFRDGCLTESIPAAFPAIAFADGAAGPNTCALVQHTAFLVDQPDS